MTIKDALVMGGALLRQAGIQTVEQDVRLLLGAVTGLSTAQIIAHPEFALSPEQLALFQDWIAKRSRHYPLQYLTGEQEFYGRPFKVTPDVLIPRPETELLVDSVLGLAKDLAGEPIRIVEVGTGSGCVSISVLLEEPRARVVATDISPEAVAVARTNAQRHGCAERLELLIGDVLAPVQARRERCHLIVSNPPYVSIGSPNVELSVLKYEPRLAVFAGASGLEIYCKIFEEGSQVLEPEGFLVVELGYGIFPAVQDLAERSGWRLKSIEKDLAGIDRCAIFKRGA